MKAELRCPEEKMIRNWLLSKLKHIVLPAQSRELFKIK